MPICIELRLRLKKKPKKEARNIPKKKPKKCKSEYLFKN